MASSFRLALYEIENEETPLNRDLLAMLSGPTREESQAFVEALGRLSQRRRREVLARMVRYAVESFDLDFVDIFRLCIRDHDPVVRHFAIRGLWEDERPDLIKPLLQMLAKDPDHRVRAAAATSLGRFVFLAECEEIDPQRGELIRQELERTINDPQERIEVIRRAVEALAFINDDQVRQIIERTYAHWDRRMQLSALFAMGRSADPFWTDIVLDELYSDSPAMRYEAARACGEIQIKKAVPRLIQLIRDTDRAVQEMAIWALGQIGGNKARAALIRCIEEDDDRLRAAAEDALDEAEFASRLVELMSTSLEETDLTEGQDSWEEEEEDWLGPDEEEWPDDVIDI